MSEESYAARNYDTTRAPSLRREPSIPRVNLDAPNPPVALPQVSDSGSVVDGPACRVTHSTHLGRAARGLAMDFEDSEEDTADSAAAPEGA
jgi:hypothetical protein